MKVYEFELNNTIKCHDCEKDIKPHNKIYMLKLEGRAQDYTTLYLCKDCKMKLKCILEAI